MPCWHGAAAPHLADAAWRVPVQRAGQDRRQLLAEPQVCHGFRRFTNSILLMVPVRDGLFFGYIKTKHVAFWLLGSIMPLKGSLVNEGVNETP